MIPTNCSKAHIQLVDTSSCQGTSLIPCCHGPYGLGNFLPETSVNADSQNFDLLQQNFQKTWNTMLTWQVGLQSLVNIQSIVQASVLTASGSQGAVPHTWLYAAHSRTPTHTTSSSTIPSHRNTVAIKILRFFALALLKVFWTRSHFYLQATVFSDK